MSLMMPMNTYEDDTDCHSISLRDMVAGGSLYTRSNSSPNPAQPMAALDQLSFKRMSIVSSSIVNSRGRFCCTQPSFDDSIFT